MKDCAGVFRKTNSIRFVKKAGLAGGPEIFPWAKEEGPGNWPFRSSSTWNTVPETRARHLT
ncbi:MAG: hypothetical protein DRH56_08660 [Deltaproteobacteria bacterium]|nr:MAG: hypothetical protein DRH56_08660 [Deltaproteobacteria bacterium]